MRTTICVVLIAVWISWAPAARAGLVADLNADWSDTNNSNQATFGTWSYRQGTSLLAQVPNWNANGSVGFTTTQPAWAPSNNGGDFLPAEFKARSVPTGADWQVGDVVVHTTDTGNGASNGPANFLWTSSNAGTVTISGDVWAAELASGRDNSWSLLVNGVVVSSGAIIDPYDRANPFLFSNGTGGLAALTQTVTAGSTIELLIAKTDDSPYGFFVGANLTITEASVVPEPSSLTLVGLAGVFGTAVAAWRRRKSAVQRRPMSP